MSAFNVGKKVSAAVRILQRKRDASARATHLKAENWIVQYSTNERKQMSTKTSIKRIALVAAAALTLGGFSAVSAQAAAYTGTVAYSTTVTTAYSGAGTTSGAQVAGGTAIVTFKVVAEDVSLAAAPVATISSSGVGSITAAAFTHTASPDGTNGSVSAVGNSAAVSVSTGLAFPSASVQWNGAFGSTGIAAGETETVTLTLTSAVAGTQTITSTVRDTNGTPIGTTTATVTWSATSAGLGVVASQSTFYVAPAGTTCVYGTNHSSDLVTASAAAAVTSGTSTSVPVVCLMTRDASGNGVATSSVTVFGNLGQTATVNTVTDGKHVASALSTASTTGLSTITAIVKDTYSNVITLTTPYTYYGSLKTLALVNITYAAYYKGAAAAGASTDAYTSLITGGTGDVGTAGSKLGILTLVGKDSNGAQIDLNVAANSTGTSFTIDSDAVTGVPATKTSDALGDSIAPAYNATKDIAKLGGNALLVTCGAVKAEKLTVTAYGKDSAGATVASNSVDFYCSNVSTTVAVSAASSSVDAGGTTTVTATVKDTNGYPVPDGTAVTFAATGAGAIAPSSGSTSNGVAGTTDTNLVNFIANGDGGAATVTAIAGNYSGSTSISVAGGSGAASLSLDAANAATDAANNAYDEAQNATQAASDALAAVTALSAQVGALIATVKSLAAVVAKIKAKVKA